MGKTIIWINIFILVVLMPKIGLSGGTVVADGGHVVECRNKIYFLDVFEYQIKNSINLDHSRPDNLVKQSELFISELKKAYSLNEDELLGVEIVNRRMHAGLVWPWSNHTVYYREFFSNEPEIDSKLLNLINEKKCDIRPIVWNVPPENYVAYSSYDICSGDGELRQNCLLIDKRAFRALSKLEKSCLIAHELLREINEFRPIFHTDFQLRQLTMNLCLKFQ
jgi:hypothetical protein